MDLFEDLENQPENLQYLCYQMAIMAENEHLFFNDLEYFLKEFREIGYTFSYGMDGEPYNLRKIEVKKTFNEFLQMGEYMNNQLKEMQSIGFKIELNNMLYENGIAEIK